VSYKGKGKGSNPNSVKALQPTMIKKGSSAPAGAGRPKGSHSLKERLQKYLDLDIKIKMPDGTIQDKSVLDGIILSLLSQAQKGNIRAIQEVFDRNFGKEADVLNIKHEDALELLK
jgi:hypothetical protein